MMISERDGFKAGVKEEGQEVTTSRRWRKGKTMLLRLLLARRPSFCPALAWRLEPIIHHT